MLITVIGDVHGNYEQYDEIARNAGYTIQVGDFGFSQTWNKLHYSGLNPLNHRIVGGNHEDMVAYKLSPFACGNFGIDRIVNMQFAFVRGAISFNKHKLIGENPQSWWHDEELNFDEMLSCYNYFKESSTILPKIMVTHCAPSFIRNKIIKDDSNFTENTSILLTKIFDYYKPELWLFGHYHKSYCETIGKTTFIGLNELERVIVDGN